MTEQFSRPVEPIVRTAWNCVIDEIAKDIVEARLSTLPEANEIIEQRMEFLSSRTVGLEDRKIWEWIKRDKGFNKK